MLSTVIIEALIVLQAIVNVEHVFEGPTGVFRTVGHDIEPLSIST
jgi:hypothetical protein